MNKERKNVLFLMLSPLKDIVAERFKLIKDKSSRTEYNDFLTSNKVKKYFPYLSKEEKIKGIFASDTVVKDIISYLNVNNETLDKIYCISDTNQITIDYFNYDLCHFCSENNYKNPEVVLIEFSSKDIEGQGFLNIFSNITNQYNIYENLNVYIDTTGGFRYTAYILLIISKILNFGNAEIKKVLLSFKSENDENLNKIIDITYIYGLYDLISGVNEFIVTGSSYILEKSFENFKTKEIKQLLESISKYSSYIQLCIVNNIEEIIYELKNNLKIIRDFDIENNKNIEIEEKIPIMFFKYLIPIISKKLYLDLDNNMYDFVSLFSWCVDNNLVQQAHTLYESKLPEYIICYKSKGKNKNGLNILQCSNELENYVRGKKIKKGQSVEGAIFWDCFCRRGGHSKQFLVEYFDKYNINAELKKNFEEKINKFLYYDVIFFYENLDSLKNEYLNFKDGKYYEINSFEIKESSWESLKKLILDYTYVKFIRNKINHADGDFLNDLKIFKDYGFKIDKLSIKILKNNLRKIQKNLLVISEQYKDKL